MARDVPPSPDGRKREVLEVARSNPELAALLEERSQALFVQPNIADRRRPQGAEQAVVGFYDYARDRSLVALVDTERGEVVSVKETPAQFQLSDEEIQEAERLAAADERVRAFLGGREMHPLTRLYFPPQAAAAGHRHAIVFLRPDNHQRRYGVVDLSAGTVVEVLAPEALTAQ